MTVGHMAMRDVHVLGMDPLAVEVVSIWDPLEVDVVSVWDPRGSGCGNYTKRKSLNGRA